MALVLLPSEIARLVLSYLDDEGLTKTYQQFLHECRYLEECKFYIQNGHTIPKTIQGKRLVDFLKLEAEGETTTTSNQQDEPIKKEIVKTENSEAQTDIVKFNEYIQSLADARLRISNEQMNANKKTSERQKKGNEKKNQPTSNTNNDDIILIRNNKVAVSDRTNEDQHDNINNSAKKPRLLIGKNAEKVPELSYSTLERQLGTIITDASLLMAQQEEQENQEKQQLNSLYNQLINDPNPIASSTQAVAIPASPKKNPHPTVSSVLTNTTNFIQPLSHQVHIQPQQLNQSQQQQALINYYNQQKSNDSQNNLQQYGITTLNGITTSVVPVVLSNNIATLQPIVQTVYQDNRASNQKIKDIKPRPSDGASSEKPKKVSELFSDIPERPKRGPPKREGPKNKRTYSRVTPTISEIINKAPNEQEMCQSQPQLFNPNEQVDLTQPLDTSVFSTGGYSQPNILRKRQRNTPKITAVVNKELSNTSQVMDDNMSMICQPSQQQQSQLSQISMQPMDATIFNENSQQPVLSVQSMNSRSSSDVQYESDIFDLLDFTAENTPVKPEDKGADGLEDLWFNPSPQKKQRIACNQPTTPQSGRILRTRTPSQRKMM